MRARDAAGNASPDSDSIIVKTEIALPIDPALVAPPIDQTVATNFAESIEFLYTGNDPTQTGVAPGAINDIQGAVLRGLVQTRDGEPLSGVRITIHEHPEYGQTFSRLDGMFDIAINGGGLLTVNYVKDGFLPVQRRITAPWRDFVWLPDVIMIPLDPAVTEVTLDGSSVQQFAQSSVVSDTDGTRQAMLVFPENVTATMVLADDSEVALTTLNVRASEYTVGANGPNTMPGELPPNSGYTYAVELSVDEALAEDAREVRFNEPIPLYVENFIGFPVGGIVPAGYYDRERATWIAAQNGRVIEIVGVTDGLADLDLFGYGGPDDWYYFDLGITDAERALLAETYSVGQELWRVPIPHFTPWDLNWPFGPPNDSTPPNGPPPSDDDDDDNPCEDQGSIIECQTQTLGEELPVAGAPFTLNYRSDRVDGRTAANTIHIPLSTDQVPSSLQQIEVEIEIAGQRVVQQFPATPNQFTSFTWDGLDAYGREVQGRQDISVNIKYVYPAVYQGPANVERSFARFGNGTAISGSRESAEVGLGREWRNKISTFETLGQSLGSWTLSVHHTYDPDETTLYLGDGSQRTAENLVPVMRLAVGYCSPSLTFGGGYYGDGGQALDAVLDRPSYLAFGPDGSLYISDRFNHAVRRVGPDGIITTIAGTGTAGFSGDNGPATAAQLNYPFGLAVGRDGSVYIADLGNSRVRRVGPDGIITTFAGGATSTNFNDVPATNVRLQNPIGLALGPDDSLYITDELNRRVFRVGPDGRLTVAVGSGSSGTGGDGGPAHLAQLTSPKGVAIGPDGSIYVSDYIGHDGVDFKNDLIRRVGSDGIITTVAGGGDEVGDGKPGTEAELYGVHQIAIGPDGALYIADQSHNRIRVLRQDGIIATVAGNGAVHDSDGSQAVIFHDRPATSVALAHPYGVTVRPDGSIYIADSEHHCVRQVSPMFPEFNLGDQIIPSEDGSELYRFGASGRHLRTVDATTGALRYGFTYDSQGRLIEVTDGYSRTTTIERDTNGDPVAIVAPGDMRSELSLDANGYLNGITNPLSHTTELSYDPNGLLQSLTAPGQGTHEFEYSALGRLIRDADPVGGFKELNRVEATNGYTVTVTTALSQTDTYAILRMPNGDKQRVTIDSNGNQTIVLIRTDGTREVLGADGSSLSTTEVPDPRLKMLASNIEDIELTTPDGETSSISTDRTTQVSDSSDPLTLEKQTDVVTINDRTYTNTTVLEDTTHTITATMPSGLQRVTVKDAQGNILEEHIPGIHPRFNTYNEHGLLIRSEQGGQVWTYSYDERDLLLESTDPLSNTTFYTFDAAGQLTRQILPDGQAIDYTYDPAGNRIMMVAGADSTDAITTTYGYDANGQIITTTVGFGTALARTTTTAYNSDGAVTQTIENYQDGAFDPDQPDADVVTTYGYDSLGRHIWTRDTNGQYQAVSSYNDLGQVMWMVRNPRDSGGQPYVPTTLPTFDPAAPDANIVTQYAYDDLGRATLVTETGHLTGSVTIQPDGTPLWSSAPPLVTRTEYDLYRPITVTLNYQPGQPATADTNVQTAYRYDTEGRLIRQRDALGRITTTEYNLLGQPITITLNLEDGNPLTGGPDTDQIIVIRYDPFGRVTERIEHYVDGVWDADQPDQDRATRYSYDPLGRVTTTIVNAVDGDPETGTGTDTDLVTGVSYNPVGAVQSSADVLGRQTVTQYNDLALPVAQIVNYDDGDAATNYAPDRDLITQFAYDELGRPIDQWNPADVGQGRAPLRSHSEYDGLGRLRVSTTNYQPSAPASPTVNLTTLRSYDAFGNLAAIQSARGITTTLSYDLLGRQAGMQIGGEAVTLGLDGRDTQRWSRDERGILTIYEVDALGRQTAAIVNYQDGVRLTGETSSDLRIQSVYDAAGRVVAEIDELGIQTSYHYDQADNLIQVVQNDTGGTWSPTVPDADVVTDFTFDRAGNLLTYRTADGSTWTRAYDGLDRLVAQTDPLTKTTSFAYDRAGNLLESTDARGVVVSTEYDALNRPVRQFYPDLLNSSAPLTTTWRYLATGERTAMHDSQGVTSYASDALGRTIAITDTAGHAVRYEYDAAGNRTALIYPDGTRLDYSYDEHDRMERVSRPISGTLVRYDYDPAGRLEQATARITPAITLTAEYGYDDADRITSIDYFKATTQIGAISYAYDAAGNRRVITETLSAPNGPASSQMMEAGYDDLFRLVESELNSGDRWEYSYDGRGNRVSDSITHNSVVTTTTQTYDPAERVQGWTYDDAGNLLDDGTFQFDYDAFGRIVRVTRGSDVIDYRYNGDGARIAQEANGALTTYVNDLNASLVDVLEEHTSANVTRYRYGLDLLGTETAWHTTDALGSVRQVVAGNGTILGTQSYDPFGAPLDGLAGSAGFAGEWQSSLTGLVHLRARWYDPQRGMFLGRDPFLGYARQPYSMHPYQYAYSNPLLYTDPSGKCLGWLWGAPDCQYVGNQDPSQWNWQDYNYWLGMGADLAPIVGDVKGFVEVFTGCDMITGEYLGYWRYAGLIPVLGPRIKKLKTLSKVDVPLEQFKKWLKITDDIPPSKLPDPTKPPDAPTPPRDPSGPDPEKPKDPNLPSCLNSFSADTLVATASGLRPINTIREDDQVFAHDARTGVTGLFTVTNVLVHQDLIQVHLTIDGASIETTPEHPFYTWERGWVDAGDLRVGQHIHRANGGYGIVQAIAVETEPQVMYNLTVAEAHTFFVGEGRWLVHNACSVNFDPSQLQAKFKHAPDFGIPGNYNKANAQAFKDALIAHIDASDTQVIVGTYRGNPVTHYFNPTTGNNVIVDTAGNFVSGWHLSPIQANYVLTTGNLGGG